MITRATQAVACYINKTGWFRLMITVISGTFVAGGIYTQTLSRVEALEVTATKQESVNKQLLKDTAEIKGILRVMLRDGGGE